VCVQLSVKPFLKRTVMKLILHGRKTGVKMSKLIKFLSTDFIYRMVNGFDFICL